ncbi:hypothetical protein [Marinomonas aquiplantarum]|uniref:Uncharacterized protein n=1 Tax=Marinomonas aquiplantarum TaxID=491951 RepID=A0A366D9M5_9GAMM|nr:hypothetical protein [Marinomonas aquiplantarum]RBO86144.1 hypothetical protein DFP76_101421 [Marinomonas aquiplantarum]
MNICKRGLIVICLLFSPVLMSANGSVNEINTCLALTEFLDEKIALEVEVYSQQQIDDMRKGLNIYAYYLKHTVIKTKLLDMYAGNKVQAQLMWNLFYRQKNTFIKHLSQHYSVNKIPSDYSVALSKCLVKAKPAHSQVAQPIANTLILMGK